MHPDEARLCPSPRRMRSTFSYGLLRIFEPVLMNERGQRPGQRKDEESLGQMGGWGKGQPLPALRESPSGERTPFDIFSAIWT